MITSVGFYFLEDLVNIQLPMSGIGAIKLHFSLFGSLRIYVTSHMGLEAMHYITRSGFGSPRQ